MSDVGAGVAVGTARDVLGHAHARARSLYVHVPFCFHKCHYCDFYSFVDSRDRQGAFVERLIEEMAFLAEHAGALRTVFVGGGTPTLLKVELWERLLKAMGGLFDLGGLEEFTVECNPETASAELFGVLKAGGVDRVSVGAQSFEPRHLKTLERWHEPGNVGRALELAHAAGIARRNVDLIYGIPGQTLEEWRVDVETALALDPGVEHLSCYALTYEPNTAMTARLGRGEFCKADEDVEADMYEWTVERLGRAGMRRYEVSNFARAGAEAKHNVVYWRQEGWLAGGPSASGHVVAEGGGWRWKNVARLTDWMDGVGANGGASPVVDVERPDPRKALRERVMMGLRLEEGLDEEGLYAEARAAGCEEGVRGAVARERESGLVAEEGDGRVRVTARGMLMADGVARRVMGGVGKG